MVLSRVREIRKLCVQQNPVHFVYDKSDDDFFFSLMCYFMANEGIQTYCDNASEKNLEDITLEDCEKAYEQGISAMLNDGKLFGFKKAV